MLTTHVGRSEPAANDATTIGRRQSDGIAYYPSALLHAALPLCKPKGVDSWERSSPTVALKIVSGVDAAGQQIGLPYGSIARKLVTWVATEARRTKSPEIRLGTRVAAFLWSLGLTASGGETGVIPRVKDQMRRLFASSILVERREDSWRASLGGQGKGAARGELWTASPDLLEEPIGSTLTLSEFFMTDLAGHSVPVDRLALLDLSTSPLAMDIYCWLTWRSSFLRAGRAFGWEELQQQFGTQAQVTRKFREVFRQALTRVLVVYPAVRVVPATSGLLLMPSPTAVRRVRH